jgi:dihydrofolate reductase
MTITAIVAMDYNGLIGSGGKLPWHIPDDLRRFKDYTIGKPCLMGRRTWESLGGKPLLGRKNIVISRTLSPGFQDAGGFHPFSVYWSPVTAIIHLDAVGTPELCIIGGGEVYRSTSDLWDKVIATWVHGDYQGDTWFPHEELLADEWQIVGDSIRVIKTSVSCTTVTYERRRPIP